MAKQDYVNDSPFIAQARNNGARCDFGIVKIPVSLDEGTRQFEKILMPVKEIIALFQENVCYLTSQANSSDSTFFFRAPIIAIWYDNENSKYVVSGTDFEMYADTLDDYPEVILI